MTTKAPDARAKTTAQPAAARAPAPAAVPARAAAAATSAGQSKRSAPVPTPTPGPAAAPTTASAATSASAAVRAPAASSKAPARASASSGTKVSSKSAAPVPTAAPGPAVTRASEVERYSNAERVEKVSLLDAAGEVALSLDERYARLNVRVQIMAAGLEPDVSEAFGPDSKEAETARKMAVDLQALIKSSPSTQVVAHAIWPTFKAGQKEINEHAVAFLDRHIQYVSDRLPMKEVYTRLEHAREAIWETYEDVLDLLLEIDDQRPIDLALADAAEAEAKAKAAELANDDRANALRAKMLGRGVAPPATAPAAPAVAPTSASATAAKTTHSPAPAKTAAAAPGARPASAASAKPLTSAGAGAAAKSNGVGKTARTHVPQHSSAVSSSPDPAPSPNPNPSPSPTQAQGPPTPSPAPTPSPSASAQAQGPQSGSASAAGSASGSGVGSAPGDRRGGGGKASTPPVDPRAEAKAARAADHLAPPSQRHSAPFERESRRAKHRADKQRDGDKDGDTRDDRGGGATGSASGPDAQTRAAMASLQGVLASLPGGGGAGVKDFQARAEKLQSTRPEDAHAQVSDLLHSFFDLVPTLTKDPRLGGDGGSTRGRRGGETARKADLAKATRDRMKAEESFRKLRYNVGKVTGSQELMSTATPDVIAAAQDDERRASESMQDERQVKRCRLSAHFNYHFGTFMNHVNGVAAACKVKGSSPPRAAFPHVASAMQQLLGLLARDRASLAIVNPASVWVVRHLARIRARDITVLTRSRHPWLVALNVRVLVESMDAVRVESMWTLAQQFVQLATIYYHFNQDDGMGEVASVVDEMLASNDIRTDRVKDMDDPNTVVMNSVMGGCTASRLERLTALANSWKSDTSGKSVQKITRFFNDVLPSGNPGAALPTDEDEDGDPALGESDDDLECPADPSTLLAGVPPMQRPPSARPATAGSATSAPDGAASAADAAAAAAAAAAATEAAIDAETARDE